MVSDFGAVARLDRVISVTNEETPE